MMGRKSLLRRTVRQFFTLMGLIGLTLAAGIDWAAAAMIGAVDSSIYELPAVVLVVAAIAIWLGVTARTPRRIRVKAKIPPKFNQRR